MLPIVHLARDDPGRNQALADVPVVWFYNGQGNALKYDLDDNVTSHSVIYLNHNSSQFPDEIAACAGILADHGLNVEWDGTSDSCIKVVF